MRYTQLVLLTASAASSFHVVAPFERYCPFPSLRHIARYHHRSLTTRSEFVETTSMRGMSKESASRILHDWDIERKTQFVNSLLSLCSYFPWFSIASVSDLSLIPNDSSKLDRKYHKVGEISEYQALLRHGLRVGNVNDPTQSTTKHTLEDGQQVVIRVHHQVVKNWHELKNHLTYTSSRVVHSSKEIHHLISTSTNPPPERYMPSDLMPTLCILYLDFDDKDFLFSHSTSWDWFRNRDTDNPVVEWCLHDSQLPSSASSTIPSLSWMLCILPRMYLPTRNPSSNFGTTRNDWLMKIRYDHEASKTALSQLEVPEITPTDEDVKPMSEGFCQGMVKGFVKGYIEEYLRVKERMRKLGREDLINDLLTVDEENKLDV